MTTVDDHAFPRQRRQSVHLLRGLQAARYQLDRHTSASSEFLGNSAMGPTSNQLTHNTLHRRSRWHPPVQAGTSCSARGQVPLIGHRERLEPRLPAHRSGCGSPAPVELGHRPRDRQVRRSDSPSVRTRRPGSRIGVWSRCCSTAIVMLAAGAVAALVPTIAKSAIFGRIRAGEQPLWSSLVWRTEVGHVASNDHSTIETHPHAADGTRASPCRWARSAPRWAAAYRTTALRSPRPRSSASSNRSHS